MTYREKLKLEHPDAVSPAAMGGCIGCPKHYGYGPESSGNTWCHFRRQSTAGGDEDACATCWDGVVSKIEEVTDMSYTSAAVRQLIMAAFFNAVGGAVDEVKSLDYIRGVSAMADAMIELMQQDEVNAYGHSD